MPEIAADVEVVPIRTIAGVRYRLLIDGDLVVEESGDLQEDIARVLLGRGLTVESDTGTPSAYA
jgi:hypothetical protein